MENTSNEVVSCYAGPKGLEYALQVFEDKVLNR